MEENFFIPFLGFVVLIFILILGFFSIKILLFPNKTFKEEEEENLENLEEALQNLSPIKSISNERSVKNVLKVVDSTLDSIKEIEMNENNKINKSNIKEEIIYNKLKQEENLNIKINKLKQEEQKKSLFMYFKIIEKHIENLSENEIEDILKYIESKF